MPQTCTICRHPARDKIDEAFAAGTPYRSIAKQYGCSEPAMYRHTAEHIAQAIKQAKVAQDETRAFDVVKQLREINDVARAIMHASLEAKKNGTALFAIDRIQKQLELQAKLLGDLNEAPQVNVYITPEWREIRATIVHALVPFPSARIAVASALSQLEAGRAGLN